MQMEWQTVLTLIDLGLNCLQDTDQTAPGSALFAEAYLSENLGLLHYSLFFVLCNFTAT